MKQIKKIVLKDATKLTNSEMKKIRGGIDPEYSQTCSAVCYTSTGAMLGSFELDCRPFYNTYCDIVSGAAETTLGCFNIDEYDDPTAEAEFKKTCSDAFPGQI